MTKLLRATPVDIDDVWNLINTAAQWLSQEKKLDHWLSYYNRDLMSEKINTQEVYLLKIDQTPIATISLSTKPISYYTPKDINNFSQPLQKALYISSLAVDPKFQGKGVGSKLMNFADEIAKKRGLKYIRLDCRKEYVELVNFYKNRGYTEKGNFSEGKNQNYLFMEKKLN